MKKCLLIISLAVISIFCKAQGNLQFNKVLTFSGTVAGGSNSELWTVPVGKVWKIESLPNPGTLFTSGTGGNMTFNINGVAVIYLNNTNNSTQINLPIWLKENDNIRFSHTLASSSYYYNYYISIIEFNVTQ